MDPSRAVATRTVHAPAKLNFCLELLGKRGDGLHELETVMATVRLADTVRVDRGSARDELSISVAGRFARGVPTDASNLVVRALASLREAAGVTCGATVRLIKRVPSQAGLGGGSSDAAAALVAGSRVWGVDWPVERLAEIAAKIGSDIPFFVHRLMPGGQAWGVASGRGESIRPVAAPSGLPVVIVKPLRGLSTGGVYSACRAEDYRPRAKNCQHLLDAVRAGDRGGITQSMTNHLQVAAKRVAPWLTRIAQAFAAAGCFAHQLSGSGSAYFGLTRTMREAHRVAGQLRALRLGQVFVTSVA